MDHWKIKYLAQHRSEVFDARLLRYFRNGRAQVNILPLQLVIETYIDGLDEGEVFQFKIDRIHTGTHQISVEKVNPAEDDIAI